MRGGAPQPRRDTPRLDGRRKPNARTWALPSWCDRHRDGARGPGRDSRGRAHPRRDVADQHRRWTVTPLDLQAAVDALQCPAVREPVLKLEHRPAVRRGAATGGSPGCASPTTGTPSSVTSWGCRSGWSTWPRPRTRTAPSRGQYGYECLSRHAPVRPDGVAARGHAARRRPPRVAAGHRGAVRRRRRRNSPPGRPVTVVVMRARFPDRTGRGVEKEPAWTRPRSARRSGLLPTPRTWSSPRPSPLPPPR